VFKIWGTICVGVPTPESEENTSLASPRGLRLYLAVYWTVTLRGGMCSSGARNLLCQRKRHS